MRQEELCHFGQEVTKERLTALLAEVDGVRKGEDIECVHRMRVASRRLRSALRLFQECFKERKAKRWRQAVKEITSALGEARDLDVQIDFLEELGKNWEGAERDGLREIVRTFRDRRATLQPDIVALMDRMTAENPLREMERELMGVEKWQGDLSAISSHAYAHSAIAVEELMAHSYSVPVYEDWEGHHALRIAGKRLRYALEAFRGAYSDGLTEEIRTLKGLQDVVGDLHDCDIWLQRLPEMRERMPEAEKALDRLQSDRELRRRKLHGKLMESWNVLLQERFFYRVLDKLKEHGTEEVCPMNVALISDVHGNELALRAVMSHARERGVSAILHAGDAVGAPRPNQVIDLLRGADVLSVAGNIDRTVLEAHHRRGRCFDASLEFLVNDLNDKGWEWLSSLPTEVRLDICGRTVLMTHGSPGNDREKLLPATPESRLKCVAQDAKADVVITGHSHIPMHREVSHTLFVNPGSVGRPRGGTRACYAILTFPMMEIQHYQVKYDSQKMADEVLAQGFQDQAKDIGEGRKEDRVEAVGQWAMLLQPDQGHIEQVRTLALQLFDQTKGLHRSKEGDRELLEMAALAHDVGLYQGGEGHQRRALDLIMEAELPLDRRDQMMVACISRYHGCRSPRENDRVFRDLKQRDRRRVRKLAALLAIADALDRGHDSRVTGVTAVVSKKEVRLQLAGSGPFILEREWVGYKQCQFESVFSRRVCLEQ
ncbi:MAG TPA: YfcE family phosphodiesterase [Methanomassiliicoccales archaeon]|nr:YfcE family phosphodiesterase [Methanomassiliicoccales archaeon]